jgi:hypothetical protein
MTCRIFFIYCADMTAPSVKTVLRPISTRSVLRRRRCSLRTISQHYFEGEHARFLAVELLIFLVLAVTALWPIAHAAAFIQAYLL